MSVCISGQTDINKFRTKNWSEKLKNTAGWKKSINKAKVRTGL